MNAIRLHSQNVGHAEVVPVNERRLADDALAGVQQLARALGHGLEAVLVELDLDVVTVVAHGQVAHDIAGFQSGLIPHRLVELLRHVLVHPEYLRALQARYVPRFRKAHALFL